MANKPHFVIAVENDKYIVQRVSFEAVGEFDTWDEANYEKARLERQAKND